MTKSILGVIGGSGIYELPGLTNVREQRSLSPWGELASLAGWIRRRLRCLAWVQWRTPRRRVGELDRLGAARSASFAAVKSPKGPWRQSSSNALNAALCG